jgi:hypothetical protein
VLVKRLMHSNCSSAAGCRLTLTPCPLLLLLVGPARCACGSFAGGRSAWERHLGSRCKKFTKHVVINSLEMQLKVGMLVNSQLQQAVTKLQTTCCLVCRRDTSFAQGGGWV